MADAERTLRNVLHTVAIENGYNNYDAEIEPFSTGGANFSSHLYRIFLSASGKDDLRLFAKVACVSETMRVQIPYNIFDSETFFYTKLLMRYQELEKRHNVPPQYRLGTIKYYGSSAEYLKEVLILEDLSTKEFQTYDRFKAFEWEYAAKSVLELAKLHALSIALFEENPSEINSLSDRFKMTFNSDKMQMVIQTMTDTILVAVKEENKDKVKEFLHTLQNSDLDHYYKVRRLPVIVHGDFRPSNLMHKRHENGELDICILDYQTMRVSNPICDLMYFIFSGSDEEFREKYYHQLLEHYYRELCNALKRLGMDPKKIYSKDDFDYELKEIQPFGLIMGIMVAPVMAVEEENAPDMSESSGFEDFIVKPNELASIRVNGIIDDFIKLGVLK